MAVGGGWRCLSAPRLAVRRPASAYPRAGSDHRAGVPRERQARRPESAAACSSSATAPARCSPRSPRCEQVCAASRDRAVGACPPGCRRGATSVSCASCGCSLTRTVVDATAAGDRAPLRRRIDRAPAARAYAIASSTEFGFATADALARALDTPPRRGRLAAGVLHALSEAQSDGHCHLPRDELIGRPSACSARRRHRRRDPTCSRARQVVSRTAASPRRACTPSSCAWRGMCDGCCAAKTALGSWA